MDTSRRNFLFSLADAFAMVSARVKLEPAETGGLPVRKRSRHGILDTAPAWICDFSSRGGERRHDGQASQTMERGRTQSEIDRKWAAVAISEEGRGVKADGRFIAGRDSRLSPRLIVLNEKVSVARVESVGSDVHRVRFRPSATSRRSDPAPEVDVVVRRPAVCRQPMRLILDLESLVNAPVSVGV